MDSRLLIPIKKEGVYFEDRIDRRKNSTSKRIHLKQKRN
jgi:hypothetical protein